ncbi:glycosyltransferase family 4 protein [Rhizobium terrae]|uniref:glycosyltransferase family 4 protein n=1 Tax=Rhizobium terrae TaxID=2171756 RepID=UPI0013C32D6B|nr:glycosyltransferase family 4 protein [Rhizobium terrae]
MEYVLQAELTAPRDVQGDRSIFAGASVADVSGLDRRKLRPLLIVEAANPEWTSVPLVGWNLARAIMRKTDALLVTQIRNRDAFLRAGLVPNRDFVVIDNERTARALYRFGEVMRGGGNKGWTVVTALSSFSYYSFEREVWRLLGDQLVAGEFDLVHRITPLSPTSQSPIANRLKRYRIPFVLGPLNGGLPWPKGFYDVRGKEREWLSIVRKLHFLMPFYHSTRANAAAIIAGSHHTWSELPKGCEERTFIIPENAADLDRFPFRQRELTGNRLGLVFIGRLVPYKGADVLIEAVARYQGPLEIEILIIGEGPQRQELEDAVRLKDLQDKVRFAGWVEQKDLAAVLSNYQVLASPSIREFGGGVVVEAMSMGLVPIVANYGGPAELIDEQSGISVDFRSRETLIAGFSQAFKDLEIHPKRVSSLSMGAAARVQERYTWDVKADQIVQIYNWVLTRGTKPRF